MTQFRNLSGVVKLSFGYSAACATVCTEPAGDWQHCSSVSSWTGSSPNGCLERTVTHISSRVFQQLCFEPLLFTEDHHVPELKQRPSRLLWLCMMSFQHGGWLENLHFWLVVQTECTCYKLFFLQIWCASSFLECNFKPSSHRHLWNYVKVAFQYEITGLNYDYFKKWQHCSVNCAMV